MQFAITIAQRLNTSGDFYKLSATRSTVNVSKGRAQNSMFPLHPISHDFFIFMVLETFFISDEHSQRGLTGINLNENVTK